MFFFDGKWLRRVLTVAIAIADTIVVVVFVGNIFPFLDLQSIGIDLEALDLVDWRHVLFLVLLCLLLPTKLLDLEKLEPAFITEHVGAELDHLAVDHVVRRDVPHDQLQVPGLQVSDHVQVQFDALLKLLEVELDVLLGRLVEHCALPHSPGFLLSLPDEVS